MAGCGSCAAHCIPCFSIVADGVCTWHRKQRRPMARHRDGYSRLLISRVSHLTKNLCSHQNETFLCQKEQHTDQPVFRLNALLSVADINWVVQQTIGPVC